MPLQHPVPRVTIEQLHFQDTGGLYFLYFKTHWLICVLPEAESRRSILELYVGFLGLEKAIANTMQIMIYDVCAPDQLLWNLAIKVAEML